MTYTVLEQFRNLFSCSGETFIANGNLEMGVPMSSNYSRHLSGETELSVSTENTRFAIAKIQSGFLPKDTPLVEFRKKSEKYVCLFLREKYTDCFIQLQRVADYYRIKVEKPDYYNLPFFSATLDFAPVDNDGKAFKFLEDALSYCYKKVTSVKQLDYWERNLPYNDAPFCVQSYYLLHGRLPSFAEPYLDAKNLPIKDKVQAEWWKKNTAPYNCNNSFCNKDKCVCRRYGVNSNEVSELKFGELTQYAEEPVFYKWVVNNTEIKFDNEIDIIKQDRFLKLCMRTLGVIPHKLKESVWLRIINKALNNMRVIGEVDTAKLTIDVVNNIIVKDLKDRVLVSSFMEYERLMQGYIYLDPATSNFVVHASAFCSYITGRYRDLRIDSLNVFYSVMKHLGFRGKRKLVGGVDCPLLLARSRFLFKKEDEWKKFLLDVSKDTMWEENFKAFLIGDNTIQEDIEEDVKEEILQDAAIFLDTEKRS